MPILYTIGFTQKPAERFFSLLRDAGVRRLIDTRLKPGGQLSGFAKGTDLSWFLRVLNDCDYVHEPRLAPTADILADYRKDHRWDRYVVRFDALMDDGASRPSSTGRNWPPRRPAFSAASTCPRGAIVGSSPSGWVPSGRNSRFGT